MAEFTIVMKERKRMCDSMNSCYDGCPLKEIKGDRGCFEFTQNEPEEAEAAILEWSKSHPRKTNRDKFTEVFGCEIVTHEVIDAVPGHCEILNVRSPYFAQWLREEYKAPK